MADGPTLRLKGVGLKWEMGNENGTIAIKVGLYSLFYGLLG